MGISIHPFADQVVIKPVENATITPGGLHLPEGTGEKQTRGEVVAVGPGKYAPDTGNLIKPCVKLGDRVIYGKYAGTDVKVGEDEFVILKEKDILCAIVGE